MQQAHSAHSHGAKLILVVFATALLTSCGSFGRKFNQSLPDFLRSDPGADELERYQARIRILNRSKEETRHAKEAFDEAKSIHDAGDHEQAAVSLELYLEDFPDTVNDRLARHLLILSNLKLEEATDARNGIKEFVRLYPISELNEEIEASAWILANEYLEGKHSWLIFNLESDGVALLRLIVTNFPNGHFADEAQWKLGNYLFDRDNFIEAEAAYATIVERYRRSVWAPRALFNQGLCRLALCKGPAYDQENMFEGIRLFERYKSDYPEDDRREEADAHIAFFVDTLAQKQVTIATWYIGQDHNQAARFFLRRCIRDYPGSAAAKEAKEMIATLPDPSEDKFFDELENLKNAEHRPTPEASGSSHGH